MRIAGAVELSPEGEPRRIRLAPIGDFSARSLMPSLPGPRRRARGDGWSGYPGLPGPPAQGRRCNARSRAWPCVLDLNGTFHGLRRAHLRRYLDEFVFRWTAATPQRPSTLLGIASDPPIDIVGTRLILAGRAPATARPPIRLNWSRIPVLQPACAKSESSRTSPGTVRPCLERRRTNLTGSKGRSPTMN